MAKYVEQRSRLITWTTSAHRGIFSLVRDAEVAASEPCDDDRELLFEKVLSRPNVDTKSNRRTNWEKEKE